MKLGPRAMEQLQAEVPGRLNAFEELVIAGPVAMIGTREIVQARRQELLDFFSERFLRDAEQLSETWGASEETQRIAAEANASFVWEILDGGVLTALWKAAEVSEVGLNIDLRKIPIRQETIEVCERFDVNPYRLYSENSYLIAIRGGEALAQSLNRQGIEAAVVGQTTDGNDRLLYSGGNARYLDRPTEDEIKRVVTTWQE